MTLRRRIDDALWPFVTNRVVYTVTIIAIGLGAPLATATALPASHGVSLWIYMGVVLVCGLICLVVAESRERWLRWADSVREAEDRRRARFRHIVDGGAP